jgi:hypothetical protein
MLVGAATRKLLQPDGYHFNSATGYEPPSNRPICIKSSAISYPNTYYSNNLSICANPLCPSNNLPELYTFTGVSITDSLGQATLGFVSIPTLSAFPSGSIAILAASLDPSNSTPQAISNSFLINLSDTSTSALPQSNIIISSMNPTQTFTSTVNTNIETMSDYDPSTAATIGPIIATVVDNKGASIPSNVNIIWSSSHNLPFITSVITPSKIPTSNKQKNSSGLEEIITTVDSFGRSSLGTFKLSCSDLQMLIKNGIFDPAYPGIPIVARIDNPSLNLKSSSSTLMININTSKCTESPNGLIPTNNNPSITSPDPRSISVGGSNLGGGSVSGSNVGGGSVSGGGNGQVIIGNTGSGVTVTAVTIQGSALNTMINVSAYPAIANQKWHCPCSCSNDLTTIEPIATINTVLIAPSNTTQIVITTSPNTDNQYSWSCPCLCTIQK